MKKRDKNGKNSIVGVVVVAAVLFVLDLFESKMGGFAPMLMMLIILGVAIGVIYREHQRKNSKKNKAAKSAVQPPEGNRRTPIYDDSVIKSGAMEKREINKNKVAIVFAIVAMALIFMAIIILLVTIIILFINPEIDNSIPAAFLLIIIAQVALIIYAVKRRKKAKGKKSEESFTVPSEGTLPVHKKEKQGESAGNYPYAAAAMPAERDVYNDKTLEESLAQDRQRRLEQLDTFLKNGIIDKKEYRKLYSKYKKG